MIAVRVLGESDAGKTTLIEGLVPALAEKGRVATIKSIHHPVELDEEGKDTHRHRTAGADRAIGITPTLTAAFETRGKGDYASDAAALAGLLGDLRDRGHEYALIEGFAGTSPPAVVLGGHGASEDDETILARVDDPGSVDVERLAARIEGLDPWTEEP